MTTEHFKGLMGCKGPKNPGTAEVSNRAKKANRANRANRARTSLQAVVLPLGLLLAMQPVADAAVVRFDDLIQGQRAYNFDGDGDGKADFRFSTSDPAGFNTAGPGPNMSHVQEPGLEGSSLLAPDLRIDFLSGASRRLQFGFAVNSGVAVGNASVKVFDAQNNQIAAETVGAAYTNTPLGRSSFPEAVLDVAFTSQAAYATLDFSAQFGRYILDNVEVQKNRVFGVFVGINGNGVAGGTDAANFQDKLAKNLPGFTEGIVLTADRADGGVSNAQIQQAIVTLKAKMQPGDTFVFFDSSHGFARTTGPSNTETTLTTGDEVLDTSVFGLSDDQLASFLDGMDDMQKWVFLDSCFSGGFWGNGNANDGGDLDKVGNIGMFASSREDQVSYTVSAFNEEGLFTQSLLDGFTLTKAGFLNADTNQDRELTYAEMQQWISDEWWLNVLQTPTTVIEKAQGDVVAFDRSLMTPNARASADFTGSLFGAATPPLGAVPVDEPAGVLLTGMAALAALLASRRRRAASRR